MNALRFSWAGRVDYLTAYRWQSTLVRARSENRISDTLLALEHPPTFTAGTGTLLAHLPSDAALAQHGAAFYRSDRGGSITFHGPGQLVGYCIVHLASLDYDLHRYLRVLEEALLLTLQDWGISATRRAGYTGIWVEDGKIASIGIRVTRRVAMHGFSLNLTTNLAPFDDIVPCGLVGQDVSSVVALGITPPSLPSAAAKIASHLAILLGHVLQEATYPLGVELMS